MIERGAVMPSFRVIAPLVLAAVLSTCRTSLEPRPIVVVVVSAVRGDSPALVDFSVKNVSGEQVLLSHCGSRVMAAVDSAAATGWVDYSSDACIGTEPQLPLPLAAGTVVSSTRGVYGHGRVRLRVGVITAAPGGFDWTPSSPAFDIP
jgi:hypothetical protein